MIFLGLSVFAGIVGGMFVSQIAKGHTHGALGNMITGFTGGIMAHTLINHLTAGGEFFVAIVGGFLGGVLVRVGFSIIRQRMQK